MRRRKFLQSLVLTSGATALCLPPCLRAADLQSGAIPREDWLRRWTRSIQAEARDRSCDRETGEELGWLVSPFLTGFYWGFMATRDTRWLEHLIDWTDSCLKRAIKEPDGFLGWPKGDGGGGDSEQYRADSLLGEAMLLRPIVLAAGEIRKTPGLQSRWGAKADSYLEFAEQNFRKWDSRECWREVKNGGVWVVPGFGIDRKTGKWSAGYEHRDTDGFSNPDNKQNHIARWLLALHDVTQGAVYRDRAAKWFELMKSRLKLSHNGKYFVWNYWEPAGPWDFRPDGSPRHWIGVHPNGGYYQIDVEGMVAAFEHGLAFQKPDIDRLIATNRDFMWNQQIQGARFQRIDGEAPDPRWKNSPGVLWTALVPYDSTLRKIFVANHSPEGWGGLSSTPWYLALPS